MDQQVVRSALKSYRNLFSSNPPSLSPSSNYLSLLLDPPSRVSNPSLSIQDLTTDPNISIHLLELRAALIVQDHAKNIQATDKDDDADITMVLDASVNQRISKAVTEAFVAVQVAGMMKGLLMESGDMKGNDVNVIQKVYLLVSLYYYYYYYILYLGGMLFIIYYYYFIRSIS